MQGNQIIRFMRLINAYLVIIAIEGLNSWYFENVKQAGVKKIGRNERNLVLAVSISLPRKMSASCFLLNR